MTYKIRYLPLAVQNLNEIARYLSGIYPKTTSRVLKVLRGAWNLPQYLE